MSALEATINASDADAVVIATPIDLSRVLRINKPATRVLYELDQKGPNTIEAELDKVMARAKA